MYARILTRPTYATNIFGERTGHIIVSTEWSEKADPWETVHVDMNVGYDSWAGYAEWVEIRSKMLAEKVLDDDLPLVIQALVKTHEARTDLNSRPIPKHASELAQEIVQYVKSRPEMDERLQTMQYFHQSIIQTRVAEAKKKAEEARGQGVEK